VNAVLGAGVSAAVAALLTAAAYSGAPLLAAAVAVAVLAAAAGWPYLIDLPDTVGTSLVVAVTGLIAAGLALWAQDRVRPLEFFAALIALSVLLAFGHELVRGGRRTDLVESLTGTLSGQVLAVLAAGWVLVPTSPVGREGVVLAAVTVTAARCAAVLPLPARIRGWAALALGTVAGAVASRMLFAGDLTTGAVIALCVAGVVAALDWLFAAQEGARHGAGLLAAGAVPVTAVGTVAYAVARVVTS
jgi:hypothetical protein